MKTTHKEKNDIGSYFKADLEKFFMMGEKRKKTNFFKAKYYIRNFGLHCIAVYRLGQHARKFTGISKMLCFPILLFHRFMEFQMELFHHVSIERNADIGPGLYIGHAGMIYIGSCKIGRNFSIHHNVTVGKGYSKGKFGIPTIGDDVWIGTGSVVSGAIHIGNNVTISSGSIVTRSIPDGCLVAGNPARVLIKDYDNGFLFK
jgi:serine O-acetyltransferase